MNVVPVANQSKDQQQHRDQQQAGSLRRVNGMAAALTIILGSVVGHADIVALPGMRYWVLGIGYWVLGIGYWVLGLELAPRSLQPKT
jgi:hypothetical protein